MIQINDNFTKLPGNYLFSSIAKKVNAFKSAHPEAALIRLGIGDVTRPLPPASIKAMHRAVDELADAGTFHGYGPEQGYDFLIQAILEHDYRSRGVELRPTEIFVSDGAKSDTGNFGDILGTGNKVAVTDPVYPVYIDSNVMAGRAGELQSNGQWNRLTYLPCTAENHFIPSLPQEPVDMIYLCYPNNPTGTTLTKAELQKWVDYALEHKALILYDAAYEAYIHESDVPHSIYEIEGARSCAVEFRSFSKTAGFTCTKFNGTSYITQRGAEAIYTAEGQAEIKETISYYMENARLMREGLHAAGFTLYGGVNAPYIWVKAPEGLDSWSFFEMLLHEVNVVGTPGVGFGPSGEGFLRLTAFGKREDCQEAMNRIKNWAGR